MDKEEWLKETRTFNRNHDKINDNLFAESDMLDARDLLQVRYEMVRAVKIDKSSATEVAQRFGVSESTLNRNIRALNEGGVIALIPESKGPKGQYSLDEDELKFIDSYLEAHPDATGGQVYSALLKEKQSTVSKRTVERHLASKKEIGGRKSANRSPSKKNSTN